MAFGHEYRAVDDDPGHAAWIAEAVERNSNAELAALKAAAENHDRMDELVLSFDDTVPVDGSAYDVYEFLFQAQEWPRRLPHVSRLDLREDASGVQFMEMDTRAPDGSVHTTASVRVGWLRTVDHKEVGVLYMGMGLAFLLIGGLEAMVIRAQLAFPRSSLVDPQAYDQLFTMHGVTMIFLAAVPLLVGFMNYLVPLMIGAPDVAFPRLNALSFWLSLFGGVLVYFSIAATGIVSSGVTADAGADAEVSFGEDGDGAGRTRLVARVSPRTRIAEGSEIELAADTRRLYFFDPESGDAV